jgi:hypothetical protein
MKPYEYLVAALPYLIRHLSRSVKPAAVEESRVVFDTTNRLILVDVVFVLSGNPSFGFFKRAAEPFIYLGQGDLGPAFDTVAVNIVGYRVTSGPRISLNKPTLTWLLYKKGEIFNRSHPT